MDEAGSFAASALCSTAKVLASGIVERQLERDPRGVESYGAGVQDLALDTEVRLGYLAEALAAARPALFVEQVKWLKVLCASRAVPVGTVRTNLECTLAELQDRLPDVARLAEPVLGQGMTAFDRAPSTIGSHLAQDAPHVDLARKFLLAVLETREQDAIDLVMAAHAGGTPIRDLYDHVLLRVQVEMGRMWQMAEVTVAEEHYCTGIVGNVLALLRAQAPRAAANGRRVITATINSETHELGVRIAAHALELDGFEVLNLGANTPVSAVREAVRDFGCDLLALATNVVLYVRRMADTIGALRADPGTARLPILVGGQPFNVVGDLWQVVGADGHAASAMDCPRVAARLVEAGV